MQRTAVITGGSKGIGLAIVKRLLSEGFKVISVSRTMGELSGLKSEYNHLILLLADLSIKDEVIKTSKEILKFTDRIDILVNNAGVFIPGEMHSEEDEQFEHQMALNLNAAYYLSKSLIPCMKKTGDSYMFNICSTASIKAYNNGGSYCISKHALLGLSRVLRQELMPYGIAVSSVLPGATYTDSWIGTELPITRFMRTDVVADALWFAWTNRDHTVMEELLLRPKMGDI